LITNKKIQAFICTDFHAFHIIGFYYTLSELSLFAMGTLVNRFHVGKHHSRQVTFSFHILLLHGGAQT
jgi:hypothetical protein